MENDTNYPPWWNQAEKEIHEIVGGFVERIRSKLHSNPRIMVERKNPFLFRMRAIEGPDALANMIVDAFLSASEETMFGNILQAVALSVCKHANGGRLSSSSGIDIEYDEGNVRKLIQVKSGKNWGNSSQKKSLVRYFQQAEKILRQSDSQIAVIKIEGCCYGPSQRTEYNTHTRLVGGCFWKEVSNWGGVYSALMEVFGEHAENGMQEGRLLAKERIVTYLTEEGVIQENRVSWDKLMKLVFRENEV